MIALLIIVYIIIGVLVFNVFEKVFPDWENPYDADLGFGYFAYFLCGTFWPISITFAIIILSTMKFAKSKVFNKFVEKIRIYVQNIVN